MSRIVFPFSLKKKTCAFPNPFFWEGGGRERGSYRTLVTTGRGGQMAGRGEGD